MPINDLFSNNNSQKYNNSILVPPYSNYRGFRYPVKNRHAFDEIFVGNEDEGNRAGAGGNVGAGEMPEMHGGEEFGVHGGASDGSVLEEDETDASLNSLAERLDGGTPGGTATFGYGAPRHAYAGHGGFGPGGNHGDDGGYGMPGHGQYDGLPVYV